MPDVLFGSAAGRSLQIFAVLAWASSLAGCVTSGTTVATAPTRNTSAMPTAALAPSTQNMIASLPPQSAVPSHFRPAHAKPTSVANSGAKSFDGVASYYSEGAQVATGAPYNPEGLTAAHRSLPLGTRVKVSDPKTGRSVIVTINDRGPYVKGRVLDLSVGAARALGIDGAKGLGRVHGEVM
jgi:peptidoglycan lytic transglycosylase